MHVWSGFDQRQRPGATDASAADGLLHQAIERQLRLGSERSVLVLHLSQLLAPAPCPHHRRIARLVLDDAAQSYGGQVFTRRNGDLVLVCGPAAAATLADTLNRLFRTDAPAGGRLLSSWTLPGDAEAVLAYADGPASAGSPRPATVRMDGGLEPMLPPGAIGTISALIATARFSDLVRRQTGVHVTAAGARPLYHEASFSADALQARVAAAIPTQADPFLFRHLANHLDMRMLDAMRGELSQAGPLAGCRMLHLNLTLPSVQSPRFLRFAAAARDCGVAVGVEITLLDACADLAGFVAARTILRTQDCAVVLDAVSHSALLLSTPEALEADLIKLEWAPRMATLAPREQRQLATALLRLDPDRIVLQRAESEAAVAWGLGHGIRRFQGRHIDAMLAASRMTECVHSAGCSFGECLARGAATGTEGRAGCRNPTLLDSGVVRPPVPA